MRDIDPVDPHRKANIGPTEPQPRPDRCRLAYLLHCDGDADRTVDIDGDLVPCCAGCERRWNERDRIFTAPDVQPTGTQQTRGQWESPE